MRGTSALLCGLDRAGMRDAEAARMDFIALALALGFFAATWGFAALCERLRG